MPKINEIRHPEYTCCLPDWKKYRCVYEGGSKFIDEYLKMYSRFEQRQDFLDRLAITYNPGTAASAVDTIKNSIFQRLTDVTRKGGDPTYLEAIKSGVDIENHSLNAFVGTKILPDLLSIGKVFVYVDAPKLDPDASLADTAENHPYLYIYRAEDVLSWKYDLDGEFESILVKNCIEVVSSEYGLTESTKEQYLLYRKINDRVSVQVFDADGNPGQVINLDIEEIPIICVELENSLLKDVANYQISALQLASSDINSLFRNSFPLYTEQYDPRFQNNLRGPASPGAIGTAPENTVESRVTRALEDVAAETNAPTVFGGAGKGRAYPQGTERPQYINPSSEPVIASMKKQEAMAKEVREIVNLTLSSMAASYASGESKQMDLAGLEAGLSYIGLVLEHAENEIARLWSLYTSSEPAVVKYPVTYSLKTEQDRLKEAKEYKDLLGAVPSKTYSKNVAKKIAHTLHSGLVDQDVLEAIYSEIDAAPGVSGDPDQIALDVEWGLVSNETASELRGYEPGEAKKAEDDHARRAARIVAAQGQAGGQQDMNMPSTMKDQKKGTKDPTMMNEPGRRQRGAGN